MPRELQGRAAWTGAELERTGDWIRVLHATQLAAIAAALGSVRNRPLFGFRRDDVPLPHTAPLLAEISGELENGRGAVRLRGLDVSRFTLHELRHAFWGIGCHLGTPVFCVQDGRITCQYSRTYVEQAQEFPEVPRLSAEQNAALDLLAEVAEETCLYCPFEEGDIQLLNNHVVFHGRTAYEDDANAGKERLLLRLWLAMPNSRRLPPGHEVLWGSIAPGALRGGVVQPGTGEPFRHAELTELLRGVPPIVSGEPI
jgi:hypothetical protein